MVVACSMSHLRSSRFELLLSYSHRVSFVERNSGPGLCQKGFFLNFTLGETQVKQKSKLLN